VKRSLREIEQPTHRCLEDSDLIPHPKEPVALFCYPPSLLRPLEVVQARCTDLAAGHKNHPRFEVGLLLGGSASLADHKAFVGEQPTQARNLPLVVVVDCLQSVGDWWSVGSDGGNWCALGKTRRALLLGKIARRWGGANCSKIFFYSI
jgi:hypothetical protein